MSNQNPKKTTLLTDETFNHLRLAQRRIQETTEFSPSLRLLINDVINEKSVNQSVERLIIKIQSSPLFSTEYDNHDEINDKPTNRKEK